MKNSFCSIVYILFILFNKYNFHTFLSWDHKPSGIGSRIITMHLLSKIENIDWFLVLLDVRWPSSVFIDSLLLLKCLSFEIILSLCTYYNFDDFNFKEKVHVN